MIASSSILRLNLNTYGEAQRQAIRDLQSGKRFCVACGLVAIRAEAQSFIKLCRECYAEKKPSKFCTHCGTEIDQDRIDYTRKTHNKDCFSCGHCAKVGKDTAKCSVCCVGHPENWKCYPLSSSI